MVAGCLGLKGREWMPEGKRYTATAQDGEETIGQCTKHSDQESGKEHGGKEPDHHVNVSTWFNPLVKIIKKIPSSNTFPIFERFYPILADKIS